MGIICCVTLFLILLVQTFFMGGTLWTGIMGMAVCLTGGALRVVLSGKERKWIKNLAMGLCLLVALGGIFLSKTGRGAGTLADRQAYLEQIEAAEDLSEAEEAYEAYTDRYGNEEKAAIAVSLKYIEAGEGEKCKWLLLDCKNRTREWYLAMASWENRFSEEDSSARIEVWTEAVSAYPDWARANFLLGLGFYERGKSGDRDSAVYYLKKANILDPEDGYALCYLGVIAYEDGSYQRAEKYLDSAEALADGDAYLESIIDTYRECLRRAV